MEVVRTDGIVIGVSDLGEADRIITLVSKTYGKMRAVARGARRPKNRFASSAQLFVVGSFVIIPHRELSSINSIDIKQNFPGIRRDLIRTTIGSAICELVNGFSGEDDEVGGLYQLVLAALTVLDGQADPQAVLGRFIMRLLDAAGFLPVLDRCASCGGELIEPSFSAESGGAVCRSCAVHDARPISLRALSELEALASSERKIVSDRVARQEALAVITRFMQRMLERPVKSLMVLDQLMVSKGDGSGTRTD